MQEFSFSKLARHYLKYAWVVILAALIGAGAGLFYSNNILKPEFRSDSTVILNQHANNQDATLINNYTTLLRSRKVLQPIIENNALSMDYDGLYNNIEIVNEKSTEIITISVTASSPEDARIINSSLIQSFNLESLGLSDTSSESAQKADAAKQIITIIDEASLNTAPTNVKTMQTVILLMGGSTILAMVVLFVIYDYRNSRVQRVAPMYANRRSKMVGAVIVESAPQITVAEISKNEQKVREEQKNRIKLIKREATDILDVLQNIGGVEVTH